MSTRMISEQSPSHKKHNPSTRSSSGSESSYQSNHSCHGAQSAISSRGGQDNRQSNQGFGSSTGTQNSYSGVRSEMSRYTQDNTSMKGLIGRTSQNNSGTSSYSSTRSDSNRCSQDNKSMLSLTSRSIQDCETSTQFKNSYSAGSYSGTNRSMLNQDKTSTKSLIGPSSHLSRITAQSKDSYSSTPSETSWPGQQDYQEFRSSTGTKNFYSAGFYSGTTRSNISQDTTSRNAIRRIMG